MSRGLRKQFSLVVPRLVGLCLVQRWRQLSLKAIPLKSKGFLKQAQVLILELKKSKLTRLLPATGERQFSALGGSGLC